MGAQEMQATAGGKSLQVLMFVRLKPQMGLVPGTGTNVRGLK